MTMTVQQQNSLRSWISRCNDHGRNLPPQTLEIFVQNGVCEDDLADLQHADLMGLGFKLYNDRKKILEAINLDFNNGVILAQCFNQEGAERRHPSWLLPILTNDVDPERTRYKDQRKKGPILTRQREEHSTRGLMLGDPDVQYKEPRGFANGQPKPLGGRRGGRRPPGGRRFDGREGRGVQHQRDFFDGNAAASLNEHEQEKFADELAATMDKLVIEGEDEQIAGLAPIPLGAGGVMFDGDDGGDEVGMDEEAPAAISRQFSKCKSKDCNHPSSGNSPFCRNHAE